MKLNGKVFDSLSNLEGIYVINLKTEKATDTNKDGEFSIAATMGDTLIFARHNLKRQELV